MALKPDHALRIVPDEPEATLDEFCHNEIFDLMGNRRRRYIICCLVHEGKPVRIRRLARQIASWENDSASKEVSSSQYQSVYNSLYQTHFPKLEDGGFIEYDRSENKVYPTDRIAEIEPFIRSHPSEFEEHREGVLLGLGGGVLLGGTAVGAFLLPLSVSEYVALAAVLVSIGTVVLGTRIR